MLQSLHVQTGKLICAACCRCLMFVHKRPVPQFLLVCVRWCECPLPFTIFPFPVPEWPTHTWPIVCWYDLSTADPSDTHTHMHTHTALSVTASLFTHWETLSTFMALTQWGALSGAKRCSPRPPASSPSAPGLDCPVYQGYSLPVLLCFTSNCPAKTAEQTASEQLTKRHKCYQWCRSCVHL